MKKINYPQLPIFKKEDVETIVQHYYTKVLELVLDCDFRIKFKTDGIFENEGLGIKLLCEFKKGGDLKSYIFLIKCICQVLAYIKKFEKSGEILPNIIFIANDLNFCVFNSSILKEALDLNVEWNQCNPSSFFNNPPKILKEYLNKNIESFNIHKFSIAQVSILENLFKNNINQGLKLNVSNNNIVRLFETFIQSNIFEKKLLEHEVIHLFISILFDGFVQDIKQDPSVILISIGDKKIAIKINRKNFDSFKSILHQITLTSTKDDIIARKDILINEVYRRYNGEFYTPKFWVDKAHRLIEKQYQSNWKELYKVIDSCCGTGNLVRDYFWDDLVCLTLEQSDINILEQMNYVPEAIKMQYDFLNDGVNPIGGIVYDTPKFNLFNPKTKPLFYFMNPPFTGLNNLMGKNKKGVFKETKTAFNFKKLKLSGGSGKGISRSRLFLYEACQKIIDNKIDKSVIATFMSTNDLTKGEFYKLREWMYQSGFDFKTGFCFQASEFSNVNNNWGISFVIFEYNINNKDRPAKNFNDVYELQIIDRDNKTSTPITYYGVSELIVNWPKRLVPKKSEELKLSLTSALKAEKGALKKIVVDSLGYLSRVKSNNWSIWSSIGTNSGTPITVENFKECCATFTAGKFSTNKWYDESKELMIPNTNHQDYNEWNNNCIIYSIFSEQSSLRRVPNKGIWTKIDKGIITTGISNIINQFFWLPTSKMYELELANNFSDLNRDLILFPQERFVYNILQTTTLSPEAKNLLNKATDLLEKSFIKRKDLHIKYPEWHLNAWDAGWYQIKKILELYFVKELKEFDNLFKIFENNLGEGIYKFEFLK